MLFENFLKEQSLWGVWIFPALGGTPLGDAGLFD